MMEKIEPVCKYPTDIAWENRPATILNYLCKNRRYIIPKKLEGVSGKIEMVIPADIVQVDYKDALDHVSFKKVEKHGPYFMVYYWSSSGSGNPFNVYKGTEEYKGFNELWNDVQSQMEYYVLHNVSQSMLVLNGAQMPMWLQRILMKRYYGFEK